MTDVPASSAPDATDFGDTLDRIAGDLDSVEDSMRRIDEGTYGTCAACGRPIGEDELERDPLRTTCVDHAPH